VLVFFNKTVVLVYASYTMCLRKKCANFEMGYLEIIRIDFDNIWQKYSKMSGLKDDKLIKKSKLT